MRATLIPVLMAIALASAPATHAAAGSRWAITNLQPRGMPGRDRESQPSWPGSLFQLSDPHPVDPSVDYDLGISPSPSIIGH